MRQIFLVLIVTVQGISLISCGMPDNNTSSLQAPPPQKVPSEIVVASPELCVIDFRNFTYPPAMPPDKDFRLKDGKLDPTRTSKGTVDRVGYAFLAEYHADVYGDDSTEYIVTLGIVTGGSWAPRVSYIFEMKGDQPRLLWQFLSGDRADGGLRNIYGADKNLIIETYEPDPSSGDCCPKSYSKATYKWEKDKFVEQSKETNIPSPNRSADFVGQDESCK